MEHRSAAGAVSAWRSWRRSWPTVLAAQSRRKLATLSSQRLPQLGQGPLLDCTDPLLTHSKLAGNHG
jgi:hypothetical protein